MIGSFREGETGALAMFYKQGQRSKDIPATIEKALFRKLDMLEAATNEKQLFKPISNNYERLAQPKGYSSIRVNIKWRLLFQWREGEAHDLYLDPHKAY